MRAWPRGGLWRHPDLLRLWSAQTIGQLGSQISALALPLAAILILDASALEVSLLGAVEFLPFLLGTRSSRSAAPALSSQGPVSRGRSCSSSPRRTRFSWMRSASSPRLRSCSASG